MSGKIKTIPILEEARQFRKDLERKTITTFSFGDDVKHMIRTDLKEMDEGDLIRLFKQSQNSKKLKR